MRDNVLYAGFAVRFAAWLLDALVTLIPLSILRGVKLVFTLYAPDSALVRAVLFRYSPFDIAIALLPVLYFTVMTFSQGATVGKMILKLKVVSADGEPLTFWQILMREAVGRYLSAALFIGYLITIPDSQKRALHDRIADTRVIYAVPQVQPAPAAESL